MLFQTGRDNRRPENDTDDGPNEDPYEDITHGEEDDCRFDRLKLPVSPRIRRNHGGAGYPSRTPRTRNDPKIGDRRLNSSHVLTLRHEERTQDVMDGADDFWVFGYGSLMWRPGFSYLESWPALLRGYHRSFCVYSHHYRGTPDHPGLVLGLARGGSCRGIAFRVAKADVQAVVSYLNERELVSYAYTPRTVTVLLCEGTVRAYTFVANTGHDQYAGDLGVERSAEIIMSAQGIAGLNRDYLINTLRQLETEGFSDKRLHELLKRVEYLTGIIEAGSGI